MPIDVTTPQSPGWWMQRLYAQLSDRARQDRLELLDLWYRGVPPIPGATEAQRRAVHSFMAFSRTNFAKLIVEATRERMTPVGIRTSADDDVTGDTEAWRIWLRAGMPVASAEVHRSMLKFGDAYVIVGPPDPGSDIPVITHEDPRAVITEHDPRQERRVLAALKIFFDDVESAAFAYLWLPGQLWVARRSYPPQAFHTFRRDFSFTPDQFDWDTTRSVDLPNSRMLPVHRFRNEDGTGEFETHLDLLRRINHQTLQRMTISVYQAFKQRAVKNLPVKDDQGNDIDYDEILSSDPGAFWQVPENVDFWESTTVDLKGVLDSVKSDVENLASVTRTPMHYLSPGGQNQSAEGAALSREGLVFKVEDRMVRSSAGWSDVVSDAFLWRGDTARADLDAISIIWKPAERSSLAERLDAATKAVAAGVPWRTTMVDILGFPPDQVDKMQAERADDQILQAHILAQTTAITAPAQAAAAGQAGVPTPAGQAAVNQAKAGMKVPVGNMPATLQHNAQRAATGQRLIGQTT